MNHQEPEDKTIKERLFASRFNETISYLQDLPELFERTMREAADITGSDLAFMFLSDPDLTEISQLTSSQTPEIAKKTFYSNPELIRAAAERGSAGIESSPERLPEGFMSALTVPISGKTEDKTLGYMFLLRKGSLFTEEDKPTAIRIASETGEAFLNLKKIESSTVKYITGKQSAQNINEYYTKIGEAISSAKDLNAILGSVASLCAEFLGSDSAAISLIENNSVVQRVHAKSNKRLDEISCITRSHSLSGWKNGRTICKTRFEPGSDPVNRTKYYLGIPIVSNGETKAVINIYSNTSEIHMTSEKMTFLGSVAKQTGLAIENAMNYEKTQKRAREAAQLYESARAISQSLASDELFDIAMEKLARTAQVNRGALFLYDRERRVFNYARSYGNFTKEEKEALSNFTISSNDIPSKIAKDIACGNPYIFTKDYVPKSLGFRQILRHLAGAGESIVAPLVIRNRIIGAAYLYDTEFNTKFTPFRTDLLKTLAAQTTISLQRIMLAAAQEEQNQQLKALLNLSSLLPSARNVGKTAKIIAEKALALNNVAAAAIIIRDESTGETLLKTARNSSRETVDGFEEQFLQESVCLAAAKNHKAFLHLEAKKPQNSYRDLPKELPCSIISFPIGARKRYTGSINLFSQNGALFPRNEIKFFKSFAEQATSALKNASHEESLKNKMKELGILFETGKALSSSLDKDMVLNIIAELMMRNTESDAICVMLIEEQNHAYSFEKTLRTAVSIGLSDKYRNRRFGTNERLIKEVICSNESVMKTYRSENDKDFPDSLRDIGIRTILAVPMRHRGKTRGILNVYRKAAKKYTGYECSLLAILADLAAGAIENAGMYESQKAVADIIQSIVMPKKEYKFPGVEVGYKYIPTGDISGDYFDLIPIDRNKFSVVIADVSGKGHSAAIYTVRVKYLLRAYASAGQSPSEVLSNVNSTILPETAWDKFISLMYLVIDTESKTITYASAGHEPGILYSGSKGRSERIAADGLLIGISGGVEFEEKTKSYEKGDIVALYTDGITEATNADGEQFGSERIDEIIRRNSDKNAQSIANAIHAAVHRHTKRKFHDDFSLIIIKF